MKLNKLYEVSGYQGVFEKQGKNCYTPNNNIKISLPLAPINDPQNFN